MNLVGGFIILTLIAASFGSECKHDWSACTNINCTSPLERVGCEHEICTCVPRPTPCLDVLGCLRERCQHHDQQPVCFDNECTCMHLHHHD